eukprot:COSAG01_NODE_5647_length_4118_cov_6.676288_3_plen_82_part_00
MHLKRAPHLSSRPCVGQRNCKQQRPVDMAEGAGHRAVATLLSERWLRHRVAELERELASSEAEATAQRCGVRGVLFGGRFD